MTNYAIAGRTNFSPVAFFDYSGFDPNIHTLTPGLSQRTGSTYNTDGQGNVSYDPVGYQVENRRWQGGGYGNQSGQWYGNQGGQWGQVGWGGGQWGGGNQVGWNQGSWNQGGWNQGGWNQGGWNQGGWNQGGWNQGGWNQGGWNQGGGNQGGGNQGNQWGFNQFGGNNTDGNNQAFNNRYKQNVGVSGALGKINFYSDVLSSGTGFVNNANGLAGALGNLLSNVLTFFPNLSARYNGSNAIRLGAQGDKNNAKAYRNGAQINEMESRWERDEAAGIFGFGGHPVNRGGNRGGNEPDADPSRSMRGSRRSGNTDVDGQGTDQPESPQGPQLSKQENRRNNRLKEAQKELGALPATGRDEKQEDKFNSLTKKVKGLQDQLTKSGATKRIADYEAVKLARLDAQEAQMENQVAQLEGEQNIKDTIRRFTKNMQTSNLASGSGEEEQESRMYYLGEAYKDLRKLEAGGYLLDFDAVSGTVKFVDPRTAGPKKSLKSIMAATSKAQATGDYGDPVSLADIKFAVTYIQREERGLNIEQEPETETTKPPAAKGPGDVLITDDVLKGLLNSLVSTTTSITKVIDTVKAAKPDVNGDQKLQTSEFAGLLNNATFAPLIPTDAAKKATFDALVAKANITLDANKRYVVADTKTTTTPPNGGNKEGRATGK